MQSPTKRFGCVIDTEDNDWDRFLPICITLAGAGYKITIFCAGQIGEYMAQVLGSVGCPVQVHRDAGGLAGEWDLLLAPEGTRQILGSDARQIITYKSQVRANREDKKHDLYAQVASALRHDASPPWPRRSAGRSQDALNPKLVLLISVNDAEDYWRQAWPLNYWQLLARMITNQGMDVAVAAETATALDAFQCADWGAEIRVSLYHLTGALPRELTGSNIVYVGCDTALVRSLVWQGCRVVLLSGPTEYISQHASAAALTCVRAKTVCAPCSASSRWEDCTDNLCMRTLSPADVWQTLQRFLEQPSDSLVELSVCTQMTEDRLPQLEGMIASVRQQLSNTVAKEFCLGFYGGDDGFNQANSKLEALYSCGWKVRTLRLTECKDYNQMRDSVIRTSTGAFIFNPDIDFRFEANLLRIVKRDVLTNKGTIQVYSIPVFREEQGQVVGWPGPYNRAAPHGWHKTNAEPRKICNAASIHDLIKTRAEGTAVDVWTLAAESIHFMERWLYDALGGYYLGWSGYGGEKIEFDTRIDLLGIQRLVLCGTSIVHQEHPTSSGHQSYLQDTKKQNERAQQYIERVLHLSNSRWFDTTIEKLGLQPNREPTQARELAPLKGIYAEHTWIILGNGPGAAKLGSHWPDWSRSRRVRSLTVNRPVRGCWPTHFWCFADRLWNSVSIKQRRAFLCSTDGMILTTTWVTSSLGNLARLTDIPNRTRCRLAQVYSLSKGDFGKTLPVGIVPVSGTYAALQFVQYFGAKRVIIIGCDLATADAPGDAHPTDTVKRRSFEAEIEAHLSIADHCPEFAQKLEYYSDLLSQSRHFHSTLRVESLRSGYAALATLAHLESEERGQLVANQDAQ